MSEINLREAVADLHQYLSDHLPPLMVAESMSLLIQQSAALVAPQIDAWAAQQQTRAPGVATADFLYHAAKKIAVLGELDLLPKEDLARYVTELSEELIEYCPDGDRDLLRQNLERLKHISSNDVAPSGAVEVLHRPSSSTPPAAPAAGPLNAEAALGLKRLSILLERLTPLAQAAAGGSAEPRAVLKRNEVASQFVTAAAVQAKSQTELEQHLAPLRQYGIPTEMNEIFRTLARTLPGWGTIATGAGEGAAPTLAGAQVNAMRQIVSLVEDPAEAAQRFREMVHAAIEQFGEGNLGRAITMFELAERLVTEKKIQAAFVDPLRRAHESLSAEKLKKFVERGDTKSTLAPVLNFFFALRPDGLLKDLNGEPDRTRRQRLLSFLEAHGAPARAQARELLRASVETPNAQVDPFFQMNLVYLLRVIPRPEDVSLEEEVSLVTRAPGRDSPPPLVKQVIAYLGFTRHEKCERALITYLRVFENMLLQPETATYAPGDVETLLERTCAALARYGGPRAWRALVDHGLKTDLKLGSPTARLVEAGHQDLSASPELVDRLIVALKGELPRNVLGFTVKKNDDRIVWLVQALAGTPTDQVRATLQDIVDRFPGLRFADIAEKSLSTLGASSKPAAPVSASLTGDLELFGLPGLLQTLSQSALTGSLSIMNAQGKVAVMIILDNGRFRGAQFGNIRGPAVLYQLFEQPFPGTFAFVNRPDVATLGGGAEAQDIMGLILEGVRRHDEFKRASAIVPDEAIFTPTKTPRTLPAETDTKLADEVWVKAFSGGSVLECEAAASVDAYEVRRLLAHWVETGALRVA